MRHPLQKFSSSIFPLGIAVFLTLFSILYEPIGLPSPEEIANTLKYLFDKYGVSILFLGAFIESLFMINLYFPGSFVIFLAILFSSKDISALCSIILVVWLSFGLGNCVNYYLGRLGFHKLLNTLGGRLATDAMDNWMRKWGKPVVLVAGIHPNFLAISMVCFGIGKAGFWKSMLICAISIGIWVPILTFTTAAIFDSLGSTSSNFHWIIIFVFVVWGCFALANDLRQND